MVKYIYAYKFNMKPIYIIPFLLLCISVKAQECGTDATHKYLYATDSNYAKSYRAYSKQLSTKQSKQQNTTTYKTTEARTYTIPVVVHVLHSGESIGDTNNPTDIQIKTMIDSVNRSFKDAQVRSGSNIRFEFKLAAIDPDCAVTNGIERINYYELPTYLTQNNQYVDGYYLGFIYKTYGWPRERYYNIWIVRQINYGRYGGFAFYPWAETDDYTVILQKVATEHHTILVHELGHAFGLRHVFEGDNDSTVCPPNADCATMGDMVCDTDPCIRYPDCNNPINPCTGKNYNGLNRNYMNYTRCGENNFTRGQLEAMAYFAGTKPRKYLTQPAVLEEDIVPAPISAICEPTIEDSSFSYMNSLSLNDLYINFNTLTPQATHKENTCLYHTELTAGSSYLLDIRTHVNPNTIAVFIDLNNNGAFDDDEQLIKKTLKQNWNFIDSLTIPNQNVVIDEPLRMRVISANGSKPILPCGSIGTGTSVDIGVTIRPALLNKPEAFAVYPNPAVNVLTISGKANLTGAECFVYSTTGQIMKKITGTTPIIRLDVSSLGAGVYLLKTQLPDGSRKINRFVKY